MIDDDGVMDENNEALPLLATEKITAAAGVQTERLKGVWLSDKN